METKYIVFSELHDTYEKVFSTLDAANRFAAADFDRASAADKKAGYRVFVGIVTEDDVRDCDDFDCWEEEEREAPATEWSDVLWTMAYQGQTVPGSFDSADADPLRRAADRWYDAVYAADTYDYVQLGEVSFDLDTRRWVCSAEINDDRAELHMKDGQLVIATI